MPDFGIKVHDTKEERI